MAISTLLGLSINVFTWHSGLYNLQSVTIPARIVLAFAGTVVLGTRPSAIRARIPSASP